jgi:hypothetical protein
MSGELNAGDRIHIVAQRRLPRYLRGDKGTITAGPHQFGSGRRYYHVEMDKDRPPHAVVFTEEEIEADV